MLIRIPFLKTATVIIRHKLDWLNSQNQFSFKKGLLKIKISSEFFLFSDPQKNGSF